MNKKIITYRCPLCNSLALNYPKGRYFINSKYLYCHNKKCKVYNRRLRKPIEIFNRYTGTLLLFGLIVLAAWYTGVI